MANKPQNNEAACLQAMAEVNDFFIHFSLKEAHRIFHKMMRAAFAQRPLLFKPEVPDLLHLKEQLEMLIKAAETLAKGTTNRDVLESFFRRRQAAQWIESLDELFHAAVYDGFFITPPTDNDIYHSCRSLLKLLRVCNDINT